MDCFFDPLIELEAFQIVKKHLQYSRQNIAVSGVSESQVSHLSAALFQSENKVIITASEKRAKEIAAELSFLEAERALFYPSKDLIFYSADVHSNDITRARMNVIHSLLTQKQVSLVMSIESLLDPLMPFSQLKAGFLSYQVGQQLEIEALKRNLVYMGYERVDLVETRGQFAIRGGLIDVFTMNAEDIYRIELWDDEIDSIRLVNRESQRSVGTVDQVLIMPAREFIVTEELVKKAGSNIKADFEQQYQRLIDADQLAAARELKITYQQLLERVEYQGNFNGIESNVYYYYDQIASILDYVENPKLILVEPHRIVDRITGMNQEYSDSIRARLEKGHLLPQQTKIVERFPQLLPDIDGHPVLMISSLDSGHLPLKQDQKVQFNIKGLTIYHQNFDLMLNDIQYFIKNKYRIIVLTASITRAKRLNELFLEHQVDSYVMTNYQQALIPQKVALAYGTLNKGFEYPDIKYVVISETDIVGQKAQKKKKKYSGGKQIFDYQELRIGDYIVHESHGVGVYKGIENIDYDGVYRDFIKIEYRDNGNLYVSPNHLDTIQKYIGQEGKAPRLNKLGNKEWDKSKAKVRGAVQEMASELIKLYARRQQSTGYVYPPDSLWQQEFEEMFPYEETEDQINAIKDTKADMESVKIMDRLICGDVGFGKTEVAIRAAFKAVLSGKQVAYLVPTTILAQQHYNNFIQRMKDFPVRVDMMSRFRTPKQQQKTLQDLKKGLVDIVIGTHRLVSKDVEFKDLGLLIIDEEQRFGVKHKEKIKQLKEEIDVLTLTATPIPRTLHMSMIGIRDMSVLEEPPEERQPIQTYVLEYNDELIRDALHREFSRDGQSYVVHNRVKDIDAVALQIQEMIPEANVAYAHGQMSERQLENIMIDFINGEIDILVATTIIETGLDISNVNTIIIQNADHMGLAQLYQLRGRVGRSSRRAYAYLTYRRDKVLQEVAEKRLKAIKQFTEFGSGYKIALRDLEIRGAGNILGQSQHGHMDAVGYELYCKLLEEAVMKERGIPHKNQSRTNVNLLVDAYIPENYIPNEVQKINSYKKIAAISNPEDLTDVQDELIDRYGEPPKPVLNLLKIALLKGLANQYGITQIEQKNQVLGIEVLKNAAIDPNKIPAFLNKDAKRRRFSIVEGGKFSIELGDKEEIIEILERFLEDFEQMLPAEAQSERT